MLVENHDAGKKLWITEIGWSSLPRTGNDGFSPRAPTARSSSSKAPSGPFKAKQAKWKLKRIYWFSVDDAPGSCNFCGGTGLFGEGFVPKKSWFAYVKFAGGNPG